MFSGYSKKKSEHLLKKKQRNHTGFSCLSATTQKEEKNKTVTLIYGVLEVKQFGIYVLSEKVKWGQIMQEVKSR